MKYYLLLFSIYLITISNCQEECENYSKETDCNSANNCEWIVTNCNNDQSLIVYITMTPMIVMI